MKKVTTKEKKSEMYSNQNINVITLSVSQMSRQKELKNINKLVYGPQNTLG